eukprot:232319_1
MAPRLRYKKIPFLVCLMIVIVCITTQYVYDHINQTQKEPVYHQNYTPNQNAHLTTQQLQSTYNQTNPRYIQYNKLRIKIGLFCVGAQASGTTSMATQLSQIPNIVSSDEMHWHLTHCIDDYNRKHNTNYQFLKLYSTNSHHLSENKALELWHQYCTFEGFEQAVVEKIKDTNKWNNNTNHGIVYFVDKSPREMMFPHIANLFMTYYAKYYGTKMFVLLRNPTTRFISAFVGLLVSKHFKHTTIIKWLHDYVFEKQPIFEFNKSLNALYLRYKSTDNSNSSHIWNDIRIVYGNYLYRKFIVNRHQKHGKTFWLRGCYLPQILQWVHHAREIKMLHAFKIIQFEQLLDPINFQLTMDHLRCYVQSTEYNYHEWMHGCVNNKESIKIKQMHEGKKTQGYIARTMDINAIQVSYSTCNHWLQEFLMVEKYESSILLTRQWNWSLWNM